MIAHYRNILGSVLPVLMVLGTLNGTLNASHDRPNHGFNEAPIQAPNIRFTPANANQNSISDFVWEDANMNGIQDAGEEGIGNVTVNLYPDDNEDGYPDQSQPIASTTTNSSGQVGYYQIDQIPDGSYVAEFIPPSADYYITPAHQGDNDLKDSDINSSGYTHTIELGITNCKKVEDEGLQSNGVIGETEYIIEYDEEGEPHSVSFYGGDIIDVTIKGGPDTAYYDEPPFVDLKAPINPNNGKHYAISNFTLCYKMQNLTAIDAGFYRKASLEGTVWFDQNENGQIEIAGQNEYGFEQWNIKLKRNGNTINSMHSSSTGHYAFQNLDPGTYTVQVSRPSGHQPTYDPDGINTLDQAQTTLNSNQDMNKFKFGYVGTSSIGNLIWEDENGNEQYDNNEPVLESVPVIVDRADRPYRDTFYTGSDGIYQMLKLPAGTYKLTVEEPQGYEPYYDEDGVSTPNQITTTLNTGESHMTADFGYVEQGSALPVQWLSYSATHIGDDDVKIKWSTAEEIACHYFEIQRSSDGHRWTTLDRVQAQGSPNSTTRYQYVDEHSRCPVNYYRIRQVDGQRSSDDFTDIMQIRRDCSSKVRISPNPAHSKLTVILPTEVTAKQIRIYTLNGKLQLEQDVSTEASSRQITVPLKGIPEGQYYIAVIDQDDNNIYSAPLLILP